jgi:TIR domain
MQLFLSYNSADRTSVVAAQKLLQARGITTFLDRDNLVSGLAWPQALEQALRRVGGVAVFIGREFGGWQKREMWFAPDRQVREEKEGRAFPVIPLLLQGADLMAGFLFLKGFHYQPNLMPSSVLGSADSGTPSRFQCQSRLEKEKCLRNGFEKSNFGPWDFHVTAEKAMQSRTWLEA